MENHEKIIELTNKQTWLREEHGMIVLVVLRVSYDDNNEEKEYFAPLWGYSLKDKWLEKSDLLYEKYEDALEKGIENAMIEIKK
jgi:hypothetical protein